MSLTETLRLVVGALEQAGVPFMVAGSLASGFLIIRHDRPFSREEFSRRQPATMDGVDVHVASAEEVRSIARTSSCGRSSSTSPMSSRRSSPMRVEPEAR